MSGMGRYSWVFARIAISFRLNFLVNAYVENNQGGDPEQEDQILHRATSRPANGS
jgi:hypothetical protein